MIKVFRKIRQNMIKENRASKYLLYAIGEIVLVVIGILIALQINNNNETKKTRTKEVHYLENIRTDSNLNIEELDNYILVRESQIVSAQEVLNYYEGKPLTDLSEFTKHIANIYTWKKFFQINNTFQELVNSGNLAMITNDSIKNELLNIETLYKKIKYEEEHFRYDSEVLLYEPSYGMLDLNSVTKNYMYQVTNGQLGENVEPPRKNYELMLKDIKQKNGFVMAGYEFMVMNGQFQEMKLMSQNLIKLIDKESAKDD
jgi:hypothetical protein